MNRSTMSPATEAVDHVRKVVSLQVMGMSRLVIDPATQRSLHTVAARAGEQLRVIERLVKSGLLDPFCRVTVAQEQSTPAPDERRSRVGVYPIAADPIHWGHILVGLTAMASMRLDKVVYVIAGIDPRKPEMVQAGIRHRLGRSVIELFSPFLAYSPLALGTDLDGETNFGRLLALNERQKMDAFYLAGADHYRRTNDRGEPDTIAKLERVVEQHNHRCADRHKVSVVFVRRAGVPELSSPVATSLRVHVLPPLDLHFSSTAIRRALCDPTRSAALASLPYASLNDIRVHGLYVHGRECAELDGTHG